MSTVEHFFQTVLLHKCCKPVMLKAEMAKMANEDKKDFNALLHCNKDMSKFQTITDAAGILINRNLKG